MTGEMPYFAAYFAYLNTQRASMRPRLNDRGNSMMSRPPRTLQTGFNEAPAE